MTNRETLLALADRVEAFSDRQKETLIRCIQLGDIVNSIHSLGWALWPTKNRGYYGLEDCGALG